MYEIHYFDVPWVDSSLSVHILTKIDRAFAEHRLWNDVHLIATCLARLLRPNHVENQCVIARIRPS